MMTCRPAFAVLSIIALNLPSPASAACTRPGRLDQDPGVARFEGDGRDAPADPVVMPIKEFPGRT